MAEIEHFTYSIHTRSNFRMFSMIRNGKERAICLNNKGKENKIGIICHFQYESDRFYVDLMSIDDESIHNKGLM